MGLSLFGFGYLVTLIVAAAVAVYGFDYVEVMWGKGGSFQVLILASLVAAFLATVAFGISAALMGRFGGNVRSALLGTVTAIVTTAALYLATQANVPVGMGSSLLLIAALSALAAAANPRVVV